jgi:bacillithiol system protein YtxJ
MKWNALTSIAQIDEIKELSNQQPVLIFKHSTRCSISATALSRLERSWKAEEMIPLQTYFLDLIAYRSVSGAVAEIFDVQHQSPQVCIPYIPSGYFLCLPEKYSRSTSVSCLS